MNNDIDFIKDLIKWLSRQQNQHLRKLSKIPPTQKAKKKRLKNSGKQGVFEHPIPVNYTNGILIEYIKSSDLTRIYKYIDFIWENTYQVFLETNLDNQVNLMYNDTMPPNWNFEDVSNNNVFQRYIDSNIPENEYL